MLLAIFFTHDYTWMDEHIMKGLLLFASIIFAEKI